MTTGTRLILLRVALVGTAPLLLITALWCLFLLNTLNPMQLVFVTTFEVENRTQEPIWVTPVGTYHPGERNVLPQFACPIPAIPAFRWRDLHIGAGETRRIHYDWDDINFSELVVRDGKGVLRTLVVDANPPANSYAPNQEKSYLVGDLSDLPLAAPDVMAAIGPRGPSPWFWALAIAGLIAPLLFRWLRRTIRQIQLQQRAMGQS